MPDIEHSFDSAAQLASIQTDITGAETATLTESDYSESGTGPYTYTAVYSASADGEYTFTITNAETSGGVSATWGGQSALITTGTANIIDGFEDGDISEYSGDTAIFDVTTASPVYAGSYSLKATGDGRRIYSTTGLNTYPQRGDSFRVWAHINDSRSASVLWGGPSSGDLYRLVAFNQFGNFRLYREDGGSPTQIASDENNTIPQNEWCYFQVSFGSPTIECSLYNSSDSLITTIQADDSTYDADGFGFFTSGASGTTTYDLAEIL